jgi:hypothetical protein
MAEKAEFVLGANFGTPYGSGSQLIFLDTLYRQVRSDLKICSGCHASGTRTLPEPVLLLLLLHNKIRLTKMLKKLNLKGICQKYFSKTCSQSSRLH